MLSSIGRTAVQRLALRPAATSSYSAVVSRLATRASCQRPGLVWLGSGSRSLVTASVTKPKKSTTATKKTATAASKAKKTATKTKKAAPVKKKKKVVKKPVKKELTPEQKDLLQLRALKTKALFTEPKALAESTWTLYISENLKGVSSPPAVVRESIGELAASYKALPSHETSVSLHVWSLVAWQGGLTNSSSSSDFKVLLRRTRLPTLRRTGLGLRVTLPKISLRLPMPATSLRGSSTSPNTGRRRSRMTASPRTSPTPTTTSPRPNGVPANTRIRRRLVPPSP